jgi:hypothetical protein
MVAVGARAARAQGSPPQIREDLVGRAAGQGGILECLRAFWYCPNAVGVGIGGGQARGRVRAQISHVARARPAEPGDGASPGPCERPRGACLRRDRLKFGGKKTKTKTDSTAHLPDDVLAPRQAYPG